MGPGPLCPGGETWLYCSFQNQVVFISYSQERLQNRTRIASSHIIYATLPPPFPKASHKGSLCSVQVQSQLLQGETYVLLQGGGAGCQGRNMVSTGVQAVCRSLVNGIPV
jgi:hypothetical protein